MSMTAMRVTRLRHGRQRQVALVSVVLASVCFAVFCLALSLGEVAIPITGVLRSLTGTADENTAYIVTQLRLPRALVAVLAGVALGLSGAVFQTLVGNPLASPDFLGITAGASAAAVIALLRFGLHGYAVSMAAFVGALGTAVAITALAWRGGVNGYRLVLVGVAMTAMLTGVVSYALTSVDVYDARQALVWLAGSLNAKTWSTVTDLTVSMAVLVPLTLLAGRWLGALRVGDDTARGLGVPVERARLSLVVLAAGLAAVATAAVGPVAFVALVSAPIARRLTGAAALALVPSALVGALVLTAADVVAQHAIPGTRFPAGLATAILGAPYLLWLLASANRRGRS